VSDQPNPFVIALDGPAASGKSTVGLTAAQQLGFRYLDTGILYRAITLHVLQTLGTAEDDRAVGELAERTKLTVREASVNDGRSVDVLVDGQDVSAEMKRPEVDRNVSAVAANPRVRAVLRNAQRSAIAAPGTILAGRDIGTVIAPDAHLKIWLTASAEERARRRSSQTGESYDEVLAAMIERDRKDSSRATAPMVAADDAIVLDSSALTEAEVLDRILALTRERQVAVKA
jgi:cytidylate kinase